VTTTQKPIHKYRIASIAVFILSLTLDCCNYGGGYTLSSFFCFAFGPLGLLLVSESLGHICWIANPLLIISWFKIKKEHTAFVLSSISFLIALSFLFIRSFCDPETGVKHVTSMKAGYWLWLLSHMLMLISSIKVYYINKQELRKKIVEQHPL
jgi:uncharacterized membrane protein YozB (DUF420 family)